MATFIKDPDEVRFFDIDLGLELEAGETITAHSVAAQAGITVDSSAVIGETVRAFLSGGSLGVTYAVTISYTTSLGQSLQAVFTVEIVDASAMPSVSALPAAPAEVWNLLPLEEWRASFSYHPFHFWQLASSAVPVSSACNTIVRQYAWQRADAVGRAEIRAAIRAAEEKLRPYLGFSVAPHYLSETLTFPHYYDRLYTLPGHAGADGRWRTVQLSEGYLQAAGVEMLTPVMLEAEVVYSDSDGDGVIDAFSVTAATTVTNPDEIALYFCAADRLEGDRAGERWRVLPLSVTIAGTSCQVRGRAWQLVRPVLYEGVTAEQVDPGTPGNFAARVDIYRRHTSAGTTLETAQAVLIWETDPPHILEGGCLSSDPAGEYYALARVGLRDARLGIVNVGEAVYDAAAGTWRAAEDLLLHCRPPDRVTVRALAGAPLERGRMASVYRDLVARMAAAELARPICACDSANREMYHWQFDLSRAAGANDEQYSVSGDALTNPFGTRRGHVYAWRQVGSARMERGFAL